MKTLQGTLLQTPTSDRCEIQKDTLVKFGPDGRFADVAGGSSRATDTIGGDGCWILPGFIDAHLHLPQWDRRGIDGFAQAQWQERIGYPAEARMRDVDFAGKLAEDFVNGMIAHGTTTVAAFGGPFATGTDRVFSVFERRGIRALYGMMLNDQECPADIRQETDKALDESRSLAAKWHNACDGRLRYAFSPRGAMFCSEKQLRGAAALAEMLDCHIQTHVAESMADAEAIRVRNPEWVDEIELLAEMRLLTPRTLLGYGVQLHQHQRHQVAETKTAVVHCPTAHLFQQSGLLDYVALRTAGARVGLGSGIASGFDPFMPRVAVELLQSTKALRVHGIPRSMTPVPTPAEAWWAVTHGAADALGLGDEIGLIQTGKQADCLVVRPEGWINTLPVEQQASALLYTIRPSQIEHVFIAGQRVGP